jgi:penicillin V acylase-like amidase (Ntn superfamily)
MKKTIIVKLAIIGLTAAIAVLTVHPATACTDIQLKADDGAVIIGRSFEWGGTLKDGAIYSPFNWALRAWPAGMKVQSKRPDGSPGASWVTKYTYFGFVGDPTSPYVSDGQNSEGLSLEMLNYPNYAEYQDISLSDVNVMSLNDLGSYLLGNFSNVGDIKTGLPKMKVWGETNPVMQNQIPRFHFALHDRSGNSIIIEYTKKQLKIYDNVVNVMTNSPDYDWMVENLKSYVNLAPENVKRMFNDRQMVPFGQGSGMLGIPGDFTPPSRFVKAAYLVYYSKKPRNAEEGLRLAIHILNDVDIPFGSVSEKLPDGSKACDYTQMRVFKDLMNSIMYVDTYESIGGMVQIDLKDAFANPQKYEKPVSVYSLKFPKPQNINGVLKKR